MMRATKRAGFNVFAAHKTFFCLLQIKHFKKLHGNVPLYFGVLFVCLVWKFASSNKLFGKH